MADGAWASVAVVVTPTAIKYGGEQSFGLMPDRSSGKIPTL